MKWGGETSKREKGGRIDWTLVSGGEFKWNVPGSVNTTTQLCTASVTFEPVVIDLVWPGLYSLSLYMDNSDQIGSTTISVEQLE